MLDIAMSNHPLARYGYLPPSSSMSPQESRKLWCLLDGGPTAYSIKNIPINTTVDLLKGMIQQRIKRLDGTDPDELKLWKLSVVVPIGPGHSLAQRLADLGNIATCSRELSAAEQVGMLFPEPHSEKNLHIVVQCPPDDRLSSKRPRLSSPTEARYGELFHPFSRKREMGVTAQWLFEAIVHDLLDEGIDERINPMVLEQNNCPNAVSDEHVASNIGAKIWQSSAMEYVPFTQYDLPLILQSLHYYVPVDASLPTYNSFAFELGRCASYDGPILNPKDKEVYNKALLSENSYIGLFTVLQVRTAAENDLNEEGLNLICMIADQNGLKAIGIRYVGIIPEGQGWIFKTPIAWRGKFDTYSLPIPKVTPKQSVSPLFAVGF